MQENYNRIQPMSLIDLLTHCKFKDWYLKEDEFISFYDEAREMSDAAEEGKRLMNELEDNSRIGYLYDLYRIVTLPAGFKNGHEMNDGIIDYSKIVKDS